MESQGPGLQDDLGFKLGTLEGCVLRDIERHAPDGSHATWWWKSAHRKNNITSMWVCPKAVYPWCTPQKNGGFPLTSGCYRFVGTTIGGQTHLTADFLALLPPAGEAKRYTSPPQASAPTCSARPKDWSWHSRLPAHIS